MGWTFNIFLLQRTQWSTLSIEGIRGTLQEESDISHQVCCILLCLLLLHGSSEIHIWRYLVVTCPSHMPRVYSPSATSVWPQAWWQLATLSTVKTLHNLGITHYLSEPAYIQFLYTLDHLSSVNPENSISEFHLYLLSPKMSECQPWGGHPASMFVLLWILCLTSRVTIRVLIPSIILFSYDRLVIIYIKV